MLTYSMEDRGSLSLYEYLYRCIRRDILSGALAAGERLPSKRALAEHLRLSVITVEGAYAQLVAEGYVVARPRRGYYAESLPALPDTTAAKPVSSGSEIAPAGVAEDQSAAGRVPYDLTRGANVA